MPPPGYLTAEPITLVTDQATVYQGIVPELAAAAKPMKRHLFDSPVHRRLRTILDKVSPLNLTDPKPPLLLRPAARRSMTSSALPTKRPCRRCSACPGMRRGRHLRQTHHRYPPGSASHRSRRRPPSRPHHLRCGHSGSSGIPPHEGPLAGLFPSRHHLERRHHL